MNTFYEVTLSGTLEEIRDKLLLAKQVTSKRNAYGWPSFQSDEEWVYETRKDTSVCPVCERYGIQRVFRGNQIPPEFPDYIWLYPLHLVHPRVHETHRELLGDCRCDLTWQHALETLALRLMIELEAATA